MQVYLTRYVSRHVTRMILPVLFQCLLLISGSLFSILTGSGLKAQIPKSPVSIQSPNAASLGQYGEYEVSLFTGLPQIDIPIYTVKEGSLSVPVSLSYHASGVKPEQHPGWVGLNWNLNAGGAITRTIKDIPDEDIEMLSTEDGRFNAGFFFCYNILASNNWSTNAYMNDLFPGFDTEPDEFSFNFMGYSGKFYIGFDVNTVPAIRKWQVHSDTKFKVIMNPVNGNELLKPPFPRALGPWNQPWYSTTQGGSLQSGYIPTFPGFTLIDENGTQFVFGGTNDAIEYSMNFFDQGRDTWLANAWHLTKIISAQGDQITFTYDAQTSYRRLNGSTNSTFTARHINNQMYYSYQNVDSWVQKERPGYPFIGGATNWLSSECGSQSIGSPFGYVGGKLISPVYLKQIETQNAKVVFETSPSTELNYEQALAYTPHYNWKMSGNTSTTSLDFLSFLHECYLGGQGQNCGSERYPDVLERLQWRQLDYVKVLSKLAGDGIVHNFMLNYTADPTKRLMLTELKQLATDGQTPAISQKFEYYEQAGISLPGYLKTHTDHWGYNNNFTANNTDFTNFAGFESYRQPALSDAVLMAGTLKSILYPTGGRTDFVYEAHNYSQKVKKERWLGLDPVSTDQRAGGLRIKKIISYDPLAPASKLEKTYYYIKGYSPQTGFSGRSSGILSGIYQYYWTGYQTKAVNDPNMIYTSNVFSVASVLPAGENSMGSHVGYSEVVEALSNGGVNVYKYSNFDTADPTDANNLHYRDEAPLYTLQQSRSPYDPYSSMALKRGMLLSKESYNQAGQPLQRSTYKYKALSQDKVRALRNTSIYLCNTDNRVSEGSAYLIYTFQFKLDKEEIIVFDQLDIAKKALTQKDYTYNPTGQLATVTRNLEAGAQEIIRYKYVSDFVNPVVKDCDSKRLLCISNCQQSSTTTQQRIECENICSGNYTSCQTDPYYGLSEYAAPIMKMQDRNMLFLIEEQVLRKEAGTYQFIGGKINFYKQYVSNGSAIGILPAMSYSLLINPQNNSIDFIKINTGGSLEYNSQYNPLSPVVMDRYDSKGNLLQYRTQHGTVTCYIWGYNSQYPVAEIKNATYEDVKSALNIIGSGDISLGAAGLTTAQKTMLRTSPSLSKAQISLYDYTPLVGISQVSDINQVKLFYKYDGFNRLESISDSKGYPISSSEYRYRTQ